MFGLWKVLRKACDSIELFYGLSKTISVFAKHIVCNEWRERERESNKSWLADRDQRWIIACVRWSLDNARIHCNGQERGGADKKQLETNPKLIKNKLEVI